MDFARGTFYLQSQHIPKRWYSTNLDDRRCSVIVACSLWISLCLYKQNCCLPSWYDNTVTDMNTILIANLPTKMRSEICQFINPWITDLNVVRYGFPWDIAFIIFIMDSVANFNILNQILFSNKTGLGSRFFCGKKNQD